MQSHRVDDIMFLYRMTLSQDGRDKRNVMAIETGFKYR
jgi:hypothetical protein